MTTPGQHPQDPYSGPQQAPYGGQQYPNSGPQPVPYTGYPGTYPQSSGYPQQAYGQPGYGYPQQGLPQGFAVASMVLGIVGAVLFWFAIVDQVVAILAVVFGHVGLSKANQGVARGRGMAIAGLVLGYVMLGLAVVGLLLLIFFASSAFWFV